MANVAELRAGMSFARAGRRSLQAAGALSRRMLASLPLKPTRLAAKAQSRTRAFSGAAAPKAPAAPSKVRGMLSVDQLKTMVANGEIESVIVSFTDIYGRLMGKRFDAEFFLSDGMKGGTHACDYLLASDMEMDPIPGFDYANWERGTTRLSTSYCVSCCSCLRLHCFVRRLRRLPPGPRPLDAAHLLVAAQGGNGGVRHFRRQDAQARAGGAAVRAAPPDGEVRRARLEVSGGVRARVLPVQHLVSSIAFILCCC